MDKGRKQNAKTDRLKIMSPAVKRGGREEGN